MARVGELAEVPGDQLAGNDSSELAEHDLDTIPWAVLVTLTDMCVSSFLFSAFAQLASR